LDCGRSDRFLDTEVLGFRDPAAAVQFLDGAVEENLEGGTEDEVLQKIRNELLGLCGWIVPFGTSAACGATLYGSRGWRRVRKIEYGRLLKREATRKRVVNFINYFIKCPLATKICEGRYVSGTPIRNTVGLLRVRILRSPDAPVGTDQSQGSIARGKDY